ncbi:MAG: hydantoinase/oxoprolinase family protein [Salinirussus sp.]
MSVHIGIDIGGTFTDLYLYDDATGETHQEKVPTTPDDFSAGFIDALHTAIDARDLDPDAIASLSHGTTVATNALLEREGVPTGLITTEGFRDVTAIGREDRDNVYDLSPPKVPTFTERRHRYGVEQRTSADGQQRQALNEDDVITAADALDGEVESVAVSLLHAYQDATDERRIGDLLEQRTDLEVSLSSEIMPEIQEYERTLATVINAYIGPIVTDYVDAITDRLAAAGVDAPLRLMQADGGVVTPDHLDGRSLRLINSGPAAGVIGARHAAAQLGLDDVITLDMGGTSADACLVRNGEMETTTEGELDDIPLQFPQVDVRAVGAGGGSIAWLDPADVLKVGPKSAGADPGPACYGQGGTEPTVTDAALLLGYLDPGYFLGGEMTLDVDAAETAIGQLAGALDREPTALAEGILDIAATNMRRAIRLVTVEKGYDPRDFALVCYGGAGPLFATRLARELDLERALIPPAPGVLSASGLLTADLECGVSRTDLMIVDADERDRIAELYADLEAEARSVVSDATEIRRFVDVRYAGQTSKLRIPFPDGPVDAASVRSLEERFHDRYASIYGHARREEPVEAVTWRLRAIEPTADIEQRAGVSDGRLADARKGEREAFADGKFRTHDVYDRSSLPAGATFEGPAIVEEAESTAVLGPESTTRVTEQGTLVVELD